MDLKELDILGTDISSHWYYYSKAKAMMRMIEWVNPSVILDVGAGSGYFSNYLLRASDAEEAWCVDVSYPVESDRSEGAKPVHFRHAIDRVNADLVLMMDVLEHVDDDVGLLREYAAKVPRGSQFLISVPAFEFLWSGHDVFLEHKRRYSLDQIENVIEQAGLIVNRGVYYFAAVFPIAATIRLLEKLFRNDDRNPQSQLKRHHRLVNKALGYLSHAELSLMSYNRFVGLTVFCLAESD